MLDDQPMMIIYDDLLGKRGVRIFCDDEDEDRIGILVVGLK